VLGGVTFEGVTGSWPQHADVVAHACAEALLGATGLGDLGTHYPDTDARWNNADSMELLADVVRMLRADGWVPVNIDCSVIAERPKLAPHRDEMHDNSPMWWAHRSRSKAGGPKESAASVAARASRVSPRHWSEE